MVVLYAHAPSQTCNIHSICAHTFQQAITRTYSGENATITIFVHTSSAMRTMHVPRAATAAPGAAWLRLGDPLAKIYNTKLVAVWMRLVCVWTTGSCPVRDARSTPERTRNIVPAYDTWNASRKIPQTNYKHVCTRMQLPCWVLVTECWRVCGCVCGLCVFGIAVADIGILDMHTA